MTASSSPSYRHAPAWLRVAAMVAMAAGSGVWTAVLLAPTPRETLPVLDSMVPPVQDTTPVARWFGGKPLRVHVTALGVIAGDDGSGAALLSVDGGPPRAYRVGQSLAPGVSLDGVTASTVSIAQDGLVEQVALPTRAGSGLRGFVPVHAELP